MVFRTGQVTDQDVRAFGLDVCEVNWGVWLNNVLVALFQAEEGGEGWLTVHANVKPRTIHPAITQIYARQFSDDLLRYGARLKAEIPPRHRAALRLAKAAGFTEIHRNDEWVVLEKVRDGQKEGSEDPTATV